MSKRFGRNQKRALRNKAANAERQAAILSAENRGNREYAYELEGYIHMINEIVGSGTILSRDIEIVETSREMERYEKLMREEFDYSYFVRGGEEIMTVRRKTLNAIKIKAIADHFRKCMHIHLTYGGEIYGYALTMEAMRLMPVQEIAKNISYQMAVAIKKGINK